MNKKLTCNFILLVAFLFKWCDVGSVSKDFVLYLM
jgi:hypothetical protein